MSTADAADYACPRAGRWFRACHFEPRYDTHGLGSGIQRVSTHDTVEEREALQSRTYVCDVCRTCGAVVDREIKP